MGYLGPVQARYDVLPVPALTAEDATASRRKPVDAAAERDQPKRDSSAENGPTTRD